MLTSSCIPYPHGFFGRHLPGGASKPPYDTLNISPYSNDDAAAVAANRQLVAKALGQQSLVTLQQTHSTDVIVLTESPSQPLPPGDALVTNRPGMLIGVQTADCVPVLLADPIAGVVAAVHAGWRGAVAGITHKTISKMQQLGANLNNITAVIGPCIQPASYEVDVPFREAALAADEATLPFFANTSTSGKWQFDLPGYVASTLQAASISIVENTSEDTFTQPEQYFSYRYAMQQGFGDYGRQVSCICIS